MSISHRYGKIISKTFWNHFKKLNSRLNEENIKQRCIFLEKTQEKQTNPAKMWGSTELTINIVSRTTPICTSEPYENSQIK